MKGNARLLGYVLLAVGLVGLLLNEFLFHRGTAPTIAFAAVEVVGFALLAYTRWGMK